MTIVILFLLFVVAVAAIAYPLFSRQAARAAAAPAVGDRDIELAVRHVRDARHRSASAADGPRCPSCGHGYQEGDRFCVKCGADLPISEPAAQSLPTACPECGTPLRAGDVFCSKCGHRVAAGEEV